MRFTKIENRSCWSTLLLFFLGFSLPAFTQPISNKIDLGLSVGLVSSFGKATGQIDGINVPTHFAAANRSQSPSLRVSYNYNKFFSFGLNISQIELDKDVLSQKPETFDLVEVSPVLTLKKRIINPVEFQLNVMPTIFSYESSIYMGHVVYKNAQKEPLVVKSSQVGLGLKSSAGICIKGNGRWGLIAEGGVAIFRDNQKATSEVTNSYFFGQIGVLYSLFYNKRYYLDHE